MSTNSVALQAFSARDDLQRAYGSNALLLFALELKWGVDDIYTLASQVLIDGANDKKCDLVFVDRERSVAVVAQGYLSNRKREAAPANKASDLNTAASWILSMPIEDLPERLQSAACELRMALTDGAIKTIEFWYVHNCPESDNVKSELASVYSTVRNALDSLYAASACDDVRVSEIGCETLDEWYRAIKTPILVSDTFVLDVVGGYELESPQWRSFTTAIPAAWLFDLYRRYRTDLFSANVRDYLGSRARDSNINHGIMQTVKGAPQQFWAFNNGITAIVNHFEVAQGGKKVTIRGLSIVNGAQTTGAIGSLESPPDRTTMVSSRFIKCSDPSVIENIVRYNNSQNKVEISDFRSADPIQQRLRREFAAYPGSLFYSGGRRGSAEAGIRRPSNPIPVDTVAQALMSFHGNPTLAYQQVGKIWQSDRDYALIFNENTHAEHLMFVYSLFRAISALKDPLVSRDESELTESEREVLSFLRRRGAPYILIAAIGACMETFLQRRVPNKFLLRFRAQGDFAACESAWRPIVEACVPFGTYLEKPLGNLLKVASDVKSSVADFRRQVESGRRNNQRVNAAFASQVSTDHWPSSTGR